MEAVVCPHANGVGGYSNSLWYLPVRAQAALGAAHRAVKGRLIVIKELTPERWQRLKVLFDETLSVTAGRRENFLAQACADDPSLRREVVSLIESYERTNTLIVDSPVLGLAANLLVGEEH